MNGPFLPTHPEVPPFHPQVKIIGGRTTTLSELLRLPSPPPSLLPLLLPRYLFSTTTTPPLPTPPTPGYCARRLEIEGFLNYRTKPGLFRSNSLFLRGRATARSQPQLLTIPLHTETINLCGLAGPQSVHADVPAANQAGREKEVHTD